MRPGGLLFHLSYHKMPGFDSPEGRSGAIFSTGRRPAAEETDKMQTQQLQQNMKEKVKVFEDGGIRLLKKGQKGLVHAIFSRFGLVLLLLLLLGAGSNQASCAGDGEDSDVLHNSN